MLAAGLTGEKAGHGFYKRVKDAEGRSQILVIDPATLEYGPQKPPKLGGTGRGRDRHRPRRARAPSSSAASDRVGAFLREILAPTLVYAARIAPDVAHSPDDVDRVMQWGFGWERGPFELMDALGIREVLDAAQADGARRARRRHAAAARRTRSTRAATGCAPGAGAARPRAGSAAAAVGEGPRRAS